MYSCEAGYTLQDPRISSLFCQQVGPVLQCCVLQCSLLQCCVLRAAVLPAAVLRAAVLCAAVLQCSMLQYHYPCAGHLEGGDAAVRGGGGGDRAGVVRGERGHGVPAALLPPG